MSSETGIWCLIQIMCWIDRVILVCFCLQEEMVVLNYVKCLFGVESCYLSNLPPVRCHIACSSVLCAWQGGLEQNVDCTGSIYIIHMLLMVFGFLVPGCLLVCFSTSSCCGLLDPDIQECPFQSCRNGEMCCRQNASSNAMNAGFFNWFLQKWGI